MLSPSHRARPSSISLEERRRSRNRSLSSLSHYSASPFPSFSAYLGSITKVKTGETTFHPFGEEEPLSPNSCVGVFNSMYCSVSSEYSFRPMFCISDTPPLCSPEDDVDLCSPDFEAVIIRKKESASSGYGSAGSESDQDQLSMHSDDVKLRSCRSRHRNKAKREEVSMRRRSMPPLMYRAYYATDFLRVLCREGHVNYETDVDTGEHVGMEIRGMSRPDSVMQLARKFGEISAAQENDLHKSRTSLLDGKENTKKIMLKKAPLPVRPIGGIASLTIKSEPKMSRPNMFKQMEKVGAG
ncbi:unnamed protein product [Caenorhabditis auriculariae]|uniref:Uncharacterized protein n=1 Tax=Caenorhabditis auriculariae TaxID=2777116 RepID=A0A8S1GW07_9PELO|nr:unnamed protein product [Caenorhabditis auriculariae]